MSAYAATAASLDGIVSHVGTPRDWPVRTVGPHRAHSVWADKTRPARAHSPAVDSGAALEKVGACLLSDCSFFSCHEFRNDRQKWKRGGSESLIIDGCRALECVLATSHSSPIPT